MKTKIVALTLIIVSLFIFTGCSIVQNKPDNDITKINNECRFEYLGFEENPYFNEQFFYWRDTITDVVYVSYRRGAGNGSYGGFTPLLDADGTPILWNDIKNIKE